MSKVTTGKVRASYVNVFKPRLNDLSNKEEYSMVILIPKTDKKTVDALNDAIQEKVAAKWGAKPPLKMRLPLRDGDEEKPGDEAYENHYFMTVKTYDRPGIIDRNMQDVLDESEFISGDYCRCTINASAYDVKGNRGVSFWLNNVQILCKGEPLTSKARAINEFSQWTDDDDDLL